MTAVAADLDDFFKKRDKKKKNLKNAAKFSKLDTEEVAKQLQAVAQQNAYEDESELTNQNEFAEQPASATATPPLSLINSGVTLQNPQSTSTTTKAPTTHYEQYSSAIQSTKKSHQLDLVNTDEDWKPFDSDENKDYSGLRVNILQNWKDNNEDNDEEEVDSDSEKKAPCPWSMNKLINATASIGETTSTTKVDKKAGDEDEKKEEEEEEFVKPSAPAPAPTASAPGRYIPPAMRAQQQQQQNQSDSSFQSATKPRKAKNQPNINDICEFPSLSDL